MLKRGVYWFSNLKVYDINVEIEADNIGFLCVVFLHIGKLNRIYSLQTEQRWEGVVSLRLYVDENSSSVRDNITPS